MSKYTFIKQKDIDNPYDNTTVELTVDTNTLEGICEAFSDFLRGSGFHFDGMVEIVEEKSDEYD